MRTIIKSGMFNYHTHEKQPHETQSTNDSIHHTHITVHKTQSIANQQGDDAIPERNYWAAPDDHLCHSLQHLFMFLLTIHCISTAYKCSLSILSEDSISIYFNPSCCSHIKQHPQWIWFPWWKTCCAPERNSRVTFSYSSKWKPLLFWKRKLRGKSL